MSVYQVNFHAPFANFDLGPSYGPTNEYKYPSAAANNNNFTHNGINYIFSASSTISGTFPPYRIMDLGNGSWGSQNRYNSAGVYTGSITTPLPSEPDYLGEYVQVQLSQPLAYSIVQLNRSTGGGNLLRFPISYAFVGSNDELNWTELVRVINQVPFIGNVIEVPNTGNQLLNFTLATVQPFTYYRFIVNAITIGGESSYPTYLREIRAYVTPTFPSPLHLPFTLPLHYHHFYLPVYLKSIGFHGVGPDIKPTHVAIKLKNVADYDQTEDVNILCQKKQNSVRQHFFDFYLGHITGNVLEGTVVLTNSLGYIEPFQNLTLTFLIDSEYM